MSQFYPVDIFKSNFLQCNFEKVTFIGIFVAWRGKLVRNQWCLCSRAGSMWVSNESRFGWFCLKQVQYQEWGVEETRIWIFLINIVTVCNHGPDRRFRTGEKFLHPKFRYREVWRCQWKSTNQSQGSGSNSWCNRK